MANLTRILTALYCQPWLLPAGMHRRLCDIAQAHAAGTAHDGGIADHAHDRAHGPRAGEPGAEWWQIERYTYDGAKVLENNGVDFADGVAVFDVGGVIGRRFSSFLNSSGVTSVDVLTRMLRAAAADERVTAAVLDIDSPGGAVTGTPEAAAAVADLARTKPVVAYTGGLMASAAYWIAAPADAIYAEPSAEAGSIGVYSALLDVSRAFEMAGLKTELFKSGKYKAMGIEGIPLTDEQRALIQADVDKIGAWFRGDVRRFRGRISDETTQGQTLMADDALAAGLIDRIGTLDDAIAAARNSRSR